MFKTDFIDLHCDTTTRVETLDTKGAAFALSNLPKGSIWTQFCAIFVPDDYRGDAAVEYYEKYVAHFYSECEKHSDKAMRCVTFEDIKTAHKNGKHALILTIEGGAALKGDMSRVEKIRQDGVRAVTLVWNGENEIASGIYNPDKGFTDFGRKLVPALEDAGILIDVSHLNDKGFEELCTMAKKPFIATHSNSRTVTNHRRNLTDSFIKEIISRGGLIGINYGNAFLTEREGRANFDDMYRHVDYMLSLGCENTLALGSDFDGTPLPEGLEDASKLPDVCDYLLSRGIKEEVLSKITFSNAMRFFEKYL